MKKSINWYQTNILNHTIKKYIKITNKNSSTISLDEVQEIKFQNAQWDLIIDFTDQKCFIKGSDVNLSSKGKLYQLLKVLALNNGREICSKDLYQRCWDTAYNPEIDGALKTNINRLRKLMKEHLDEPLVLSPKRGVYALQNTINYCFIQDSI
ncbi:MAG: winged helix-turn-helix transcriptional regulator [Candidatus Cloacimonetes bacterium]|nr:winged helix-turn-helix transcriptional regulator [Candidatus Cloacimonadota bacterium]